MIAFGAIPVTDPVTSTSSIILEHSATFLSAEEKLFHEYYPSPKHVIDSCSETKAELLEVQSSIEEDISKAAATYLELASVAEKSPVADAKTTFSLYNSLLIAAKTLEAVIEKVASKCKAAIEDIQEDLKSIEKYSLHTDSKESTEVTWADAHHHLTTELGMYKNILKTEEVQNKESLDNLKGNIVSIKDRLKPLPAPSSTPRPTAHFTKAFGAFAVKVREPNISKSIAPPLQLESTKAIISFDAADMVAIAKNHRLAI